MKVIVDKETCMSTITKSFILLLSLVSIPGLCLGAEYYVATTGNNTTGIGSIENPWLTIQYGFNQLNPGDTLYVREGVYRESVNMEGRRGTPGNPLTIKNYPGETPRLTAGNILTGWVRCTSKEDAIGNPNWENIFKLTTNKIGEISAASVAQRGFPAILKLLEDGNFAFMSSDVKHVVSAYPSVDDLVVLPAVDDATNHDQNMHIRDSVNNVKADGFWDDVFIGVWQYRGSGANWIYYNQVATYADKTFTFVQPQQYNILSNNTVRHSYGIFNHPALITRAGEYCYTELDGGERTIYLWPADEDNLDGKIELKGGGDAFTGRFEPQSGRYFDYIVIDGLHIYNCGKGFHTVNYSSPWQRHDAYITIQNCTIEAVSSGIYTSSGHLTIDNTIISNTTRFGIYFSSSDNRITNNTITNNHKTAICHFHGSRNLIAHNYIGYDARPEHGNGINIGLKNAEYQYNLIAHNFVNHPSSSFTTHWSRDTVLLGNFFAGPVNEWSNRPVVGSLYLLNNTSVRNIGSMSSPYRVKVNNIFNNTGAGFDVDLSNIGSTDYDNLFVDYADGDYRRNPDGGFPMEGIDISPYLGESYSNIISIFPDYDYHTDLVGNNRSLLQPTIGAYEYGFGNPQPNDPNTDNPIQPEEPDNNNLPNAVIPEKTELKVLNNVLKGNSAQVTVKLMMAQPGNATVKIYDMKGKEIICLFDGYKDAGTYDLPWRGVDSNGNKAGSGIYMVYMKSGGYKGTKKIAVIK